MAQYDYDLITIGAGSGGVRASRLASSYGARVAIVEESRVGGTCVIRGCVPKKLLVYGSHFAEDFEDAAGFGWTVGETSFDWAKLIEAKNTELNRLEGIYQRILRDNGVTILEGRGRLVDAHSVEVAGRIYTAERILIAVGGWPNLPQIPGIEHAITSNEALDLPSLPKRIVIVGGGYIAVEFAGIFNSLGSQVTQVVRGDTILRGFDQDARSTLAEEMMKKGVNILSETTVRSIEKCPDGSYSLRLGGEEEITADLVMYATGRAPKTAGLGLEEVGVKMTAAGAVIVDEESRTSVESIFAVGDVTDRVNLTPVAINEGRCFAETFYNNNPMRMDYAYIPSAVFSQPPLASVGLTEAAARKQCEAVEIYLSRFKPMRNTLSGRDERTMMKLVVDKPSNRVVGVHMVGPDAAEIMQGFAVALKCGATKKQFDSTVGIHPSAAEEFVTMRDPVPDPCPECEE
ncbi:glutathione-disulfide reductase [Telmatospirillum sp. J64-1]|uniref:glutathione-disulfide reductase n=1 Tax=Telmatospirillum sp. J64-1 TaxID=2502183 RepID=UPI00115E7807|nr:glutathione-disulfide reductase [Telmatospirillum sp. J64-1]